MTVLDFTFERRIELEKRDARAEGEEYGRTIAKSESIADFEKRIINE